MVFDLDGETLVGDDVAGAFGNGPALEDSIPAEPEVVMQACGCVLLNDEGKSLLLWLGGLFGIPAGLGGDAKVAHGPVARELLVDGVRVTGRSLPPGRHRSGRLAGLGVLDQLDALLGGCGFGRCSPRRLLLGGGGLVDLDAFAERVHQVHNLG